ncbi:MAG: hypothetical protein GX447_03910 [Elusimicrobia bacterium]|nr:hypothetical protein [Elusimicrobiota bacterium]
MSYFFIVNPNSGKEKNKKEFVYFLKKESETRKLICEIAYTQSSKHARELAFLAVKRGFKKVVAVGGDGTIREVASSLAGKDAALGIIPMGSGNGFARNLLLPLNIEKALVTVFKEKYLYCDVGICLGEIFLCACGFGVDALIAERFNTGNHSRGLFPYFVSGAKSLFSYKPKLLRFKKSDGTFIDYFPLLAAVMNGRQYGGGACVNPEGLIDDGVLEFISLKNMGFLSAVLNLPYLFNGKINKKNIFGSLPLKNAEIHIGRDSVYHLDGEHFYSKDGVLKISVWHKALKVISA